MSASAENLKKWCDDNITPLAWKRIVMKNLDTFRAKGLGLTELENPSSGVMLDDHLVETVKATVQELYQTEIPSAVLV
jgi:hypothetical protein